MSNLCLYLSLDKVAMANESYLSDRFYVPVEHGNSTLLVCIWFEGQGWMKVLPDMTTYMKVLPDMTTYRKSLDATSAVFALTHLPEAGTSKTGQVKIIKEFVCINRKFF